jgi:hypothetical protein
MILNNTRNKQAFYESMEAQLENLCGKDALLTMLNESFSNKGIINACRIATLPTELTDSIAIVGLIERAVMVAWIQYEQRLLSSMHTRETLTPLTRVINSSSREKITFSP